MKEGAPSSCLPHIQLLSEPLIALLHIVLKHFQLVKPALREVLAGNHNLGYIAKGIRVYVQRGHRRLLGHKSVIPRRRNDGGDS